MFDKPETITKGIGSKIKFFCPSITRDDHTPVRPGNVSTSGGAVGVVNLFINGVVNGEVILVSSVKICHFLRSMPFQTK